MFCFSHLHTVADRQPSCAAGLHVDYAQLTPIETNKYALLRNRSDCTRSEHGHIGATVARSQRQLHAAIHFFWVAATPFAGGEFYVWCEQTRGPVAVCKEMSFAIEAEESQLRVTTMDDEQGFGRLFRYISNNGIPMTTPVIKTANTMSFILPVEGPAPREPGVCLHRVAPVYVACQKIDRRNEAATQPKLLKNILRHGLTPVGELQWRRHAEPWAPWDKQNPQMCFNVEK